MNDFGDLVVVSGSRLAVRAQCSAFGLITRRSRVQITPPLPTSANSGVVRLKQGKSGAENTAAPDLLPRGRFSDSCRHVSGKNVSGTPGAAVPALGLAVLASIGLAGCDAPVEIGPHLEGLLEVGAICLVLVVYFWRRGGGR